MKRILKYVLFILIILIIISAVAIWKFPWLQEKLGLSNIDDKNLARQAAELALKDGELWLSNQTTKPIGVKKCPKPTCMLWQKGALPTNLSVEKDSWWQTQGRIPSKKIPGVNTQPRYVIEEIQFVAEELNPDELSKQQGYSYYRITAKGSGKSENTQSILESIYSVKFN
jgi:type IV pilus assembly protein PilX